jgi:hypothetical protein
VAIRVFEGFEPVVEPLPLGVQEGEARLSVSWDLRGGDAAKVDANRAPDQRARPDVGDGAQALQAMMTEDEEITRRLGVEQREGARGPNREEVPEALGARAGRRIGFEALEDGGALGLGEAGSLRIDEHAFARAEAPFERRDGRDFTLGITRAARDEMVGDPVAGDIEARVDEQLRLRT